MVLATHICRNTQRRNLLNSAHHHPQTPTKPKQQPQHGPGAVLGYSCLLTGAPEDWYAPRGKRGALLRLEAQTESWVLQIPHAFVDQAIKHHPFPTLALAARKARVWTAPSWCRWIAWRSPLMCTHVLISPTHHTPVNEHRRWRPSPACSA